jgi:hypothetical protein
MFREPYVTCPQIAGLRTAAVTGRRLHDRLLAELRSAAVKIHPNGRGFGTARKPV